MGLDCYIVKDLMANYIDGLTSEKTNLDIKQHLKECEKCRIYHQQMTEQINKTDLMEDLESEGENRELNQVVIREQESRKENQKKVSYLKKISDVMAGIVAALGIIILLLVIGIIITMVVGIIPHGKTYDGDIDRYEALLGVDGEYKSNYLGYNDIFPDEIPDSAMVEEFYYKYYNKWDACYLGYLVYTCDEADYTEEYNRLAAIDSDEEYQVYGITGFPYELCAIYADDYYGVIYAMADEENQRFIYVSLEFCNYFTDIRYKQIISQEYLPYGFDAYPDNARKLKFEEEH